MFIVETVSYIFKPSVLVHTYMIKHDTYIVVCATPSQVHQNKIVNLGESTGNQFINYVNRNHSAAN